MDQQEKKKRILELREDLKALNEIKRSGVLTISHRGKNLTYRNMSELQTAINDIKKELETLINGSRKIIDYSGFRNE